MVSSEGNLMMSWVSMCWWRRRRRRELRKQRSVDALKRQKKGLTSLDKFTDSKWRGSLSLQMAFPDPTMPVSCRKAESPAHRFLPLRSPMKSSGCIEAGKFWEGRGSFG